MDLTKLMFMGLLKGKIRNITKVLKPGVKLQNIFFLVFVILSFNSCSLETRYIILSSIFDGVPDPNENSNSQADTISIAHSQMLASIGTKPPVAAAPLIYYHIPYKERQCGDCHNPSKGNVLNEQPSQCYQCHDDYKTQYKFLHGPVAAGFCTSCHHPHYSKNKKLLLTDFNKICFHCHIPEDIKRNEAHTDIDPEECLLCHNAHGGEDEYFLE